MHVLIGLFQERFNDHDSMYPVIFTCENEQQQKSPFIPQFFCNPELIYHARAQVAATL